MANNREISQFAGLVTVNDSTNAVTIGSTLHVSGDLVAPIGAGAGTTTNVSGDLTLTDGEVQTTNIQTSSINSGPVAGFKNKIINGNFEINQREDTSNSGGGSNYVADRIRVRSTADGSPTATMSTVNNSSIVDLAGGSVANLDYATGTGTWGIVYAPERDDVVSFNGKTVSVSFVTNYSSSNWIIYLQNVGGLTTAQLFTVTSSSTNPYGSTGYYVTGTVNIPSNWLASGGTEQPRLFIYNTDDFGSSTTVQFGKLQLEQGPVATVFEHRPIGTELALCQRYYERFESPSSIYSMGLLMQGTFAASNRFGFIPVSFRVNKRNTSYSVSMSNVDVRSSNNPNTPATNIDVSIVNATTGRTTSSCGIYASTASDIGIGSNGNWTAYLTGTGGVIAIDNEI